MDIKAYISSGILEAYALGALPEEERVQVAKDIAEYPELAAELAAIEATLGEYAGTFRHEPPQGMADKIWNAIEASKVDGRSNTIPLPPPQSQKPGVRWYYAAAILLLIGSVAMNVIMYQRQQEDLVASADMKARVQQLELQQATLEQQASKYASAEAMLSDTSVRTVVMQTAQPGKKMAAVIFWKQHEGKAYVTAQEMPAPPSGKQYQLWVIRNGKPESMGMIPMDMNVVKMKEVPASFTNADAFAISLEKEGGSPTPTEVCVVGKI